MISLPPGAGLDPSLTPRTLEPATGVRPTAAAQAVSPVDPLGVRAFAPPLDLFQPRPANAGDAAPLLGLEVPEAAAGATAQAGADAAPAPSGRAVALAPRLAALVRLLDTMGLAGDGAQAAVPWPAGPGPAGRNPQEALMALRERLAQWPPLQGSAGQGESPAPAEAPVKSDAPAAPMQPGPAAGAGPLLAAARPEQQVMRLLLNGELQWAGQLTPGVPATVSREDAWYELPERPGRLQRGTSLRIELEWPGGRHLVVMAQQLGERLSFVIQPPAGENAPFDAALPRLRQRLAGAASQLDLALAPRP